MGTHDDPSLPWWLGGPPEAGGDDSAEHSAASSGPYGGEDADRVPVPPPPPTFGPESDWLRDVPTGLPPVPTHMPPTNFRQTGEEPSGAVGYSSAWDEPTPRSGQGGPPRKRRTATATASPPPPSTKSNNALRALLSIFLVLLIATGGVALWRTNVFGTQSGSFTFPGFGTGPATATPTGYAQAAKITFTRTTQTIAAPSSTLVAATDGSGQIKATQQTASVTGVATAAIGAAYQIASNVIFTLTVTNNFSHPLLSGGALTITSTDSKVKCGIEGSITVPSHGSAQQKCDEPVSKEPAAHWDYTDPSTGLVYTGDSPAGGNAAYYYVPTNCGDPSAAEAAARAALQAQLSVPPGSATMGNPVFHLDTSSLTCVPAAGTQQATSFTYVQKINGTASQTTYVVADAQAFQLAQLETKIPMNYTLISSSICPDGPLVGNDATATRATLTCTATGIVGWAWTPATLAQLASSIAGASPSTAALQLNSTQGIVNGSVKIALMNGSELPQDATTITFVVTP